MNLIDAIKRNLVESVAGDQKIISDFARELSKRVDEIAGQQSELEKLITRRDALAQFVEHNPNNNEAVELLNLINGFLSEVK